MIINTINSGVNLINYIGHGSSTHLSHEDIFLIDRDVDLIQTNNRPPIWVVGTCSFGDYKDSQTSFAEKILKKPDAGIAILATTAGIGKSSAYRGPPIEKEDHQVDVSRLQESVEYLLEELRLKNQAAVDQRQSVSQDYAKVRG